MRALRCVLVLVALAWSGGPVCAEGNSPGVLLDLDLSPGKAAAVAADDGKSEGRIQGRLPVGWHDNSSWSKAWIRYQTLTEEGRPYLAAVVSRIESGRVQLTAPLSDYGDGSLFRLRLKARGNPGVPLRLGIRDVGPPYAFAWSQRQAVGPDWREYQCLFSLDRNPGPVGLWIEWDTTGELDLAKVTLEKVSRESLLATAVAPDKSPGNLLRASRFPLGLPSGWALRARTVDQDREPVVAVDPMVVGVSGSPALRLASEQAVSFFSEPFSVPAPVGKYTASLYVRGAGEGKVTVLGDRKAVAQAAFRAGSEWRRVELAFDAGLLTRFYALQFESTGEVWTDAWQVEAGDAARPYRLQGAAEVALACVARDTRDARIQFSDEPACVEYDVTAGVPSGVPARLRATVTDLYGKSADLPPVPLEGKAPQRGRFEFGAGDGHVLGAFRIEAWIEDGQGNRLSPVQELVIHRLQRPRKWGVDAPDSPFGIHVNSDTLHLRMTKAIGMNWVRLHDLGFMQWMGWYFLERSPGKWTFFDRAIDRFRAQHLEILGSFSTTPEWASDLQAKHSAYFDRFYQPRSLDDYANYVRTVVGHYRGVIGTYEVWNEPWNAAWFAAHYDETKSGRAGYMPGEHPQAAFAAMTRAAAAAAKSVDPSVRIVGINTTVTEKNTKPYPDVGGADWSAGLAAVGAEKECDILSYHQYESSLVGFPGDAVEKGLAVAMGPFRGKAEGKPVWMTEGSYVPSRTTSGFYRHSAPYPDSEDVLDTGGRLCRSVVSLLANGVSRMFLYSMGSYDYFGAAGFPDWALMVSEDGYLSPSADAFSHLAWELEGTAFVRRVPLEGEAGAYLFSGSGRSVAVVVPSREGESLPLPSRPGWIVTDLLGNPLKGGKTVSNQPAYVESDGRVDELQRVLTPSR